MWKHKNGEGLISPSEFVSQDAGAVTYYECDGLEGVFHIQQLVTKYASRAGVAVSTARVYGFTPGGEPVYLLRVRMEEAIPMPAVVDRRRN